MIHRKTIRFLAVLTCLWAMALPLQAGRKTPLQGTPPGRLIALAKQQQRVQVIIGVRDDLWRPEGTLRAEDVAIQRSRGKAKVAEVLRNHPKVIAAPGWRFVTIPAFVATVSEAALRELLEDDQISSIEEDLVGEFTLGYSTELVGATTVHTSTPAYKGADQIVVVIDNGVDDGHPFFGNRVLTADSACFSKDKITGAGDQVGVYNSVCPNGQSQQTGSGAGVPCQVGDLSSPTNPCHHGTRVAGVVAGDKVTNNTVEFNTNMTGVAPAALIVPIQIASIHNSQPKGLKSSVIKALDHVASILAAKYPQDGSAGNTKKIAAVNISLGFPGPEVGAVWSTPCDGYNAIMKQSADTVLSKGIAVVAATGNALAGQTGSSAGVLLPSCLSNVVAVSASTDSNGVADYAHTSSDIELFAPGGSSTAGLGIETSQNRNCTNCTRYYEDHGTSMAAPHVAGAFAVLREKTPSATVGTLLAQLTSSPVTITDSRTSGITVTKPRLKLDHAISGGQPPAPPTNFSANATSATVVRLTWTEPNPVPSGAKYRIRYRQEHNAAWTDLIEINTPGTVYDHANRTRGTMYEYEIVTKTSTEVSTAVLDHAVTVPFTDDPLRAPNDPAGGTLIDGIHIGELREAVDAWREFAPNLTDYFTAAGAYDGPAGLIAAADLTSVVTALNQARQAMSRLDFAYADVDPPAKDGVIYRQHIEQLRTALR